MADVDLCGFDLELLFLIGDAGIAGNENGHSALWLLRIFIGSFCFPNHALDIVRIDNSKVFDAAPFHQFFKRERPAGMAVSRHSRLRSGLHSRHGRDGIVEDDKKEPGPIIDGIQEALRSGVIEG